MVVYSLTLLEEKIIEQDVKQEMRNQLTQHSNFYISKLQDYNQKNDTTDRESRLKAVLQQHGNNVDEIYKVQKAKLYSENFFTIRIRNPTIGLKISDFIGNYFKK